MPIHIISQLIYPLEKNPNFLGALISYKADGGLMPAPKITKRPLL